MLIVVFEFFLAGQTVNSTYYCDVLQLLLEHMWRLRPELWRLKNWLLHHNKAPSHTSFLTREFLTKNNMAVIPSHPTSLFPRLKIKLEGRHFDTAEVIEAELQAVLKNLT
jgi:hypothetical protein